MGLDFLEPRLLLLLPLALLPLLPQRRDTVGYSWLAWLPRDDLGRWIAAAMRALAVLALGGIVVGLAGPGRAETHVERTGRGAEIVLLIDRSSSMDAVIRTHMVQAGGELSSGTTKADAMRAALTRFIADRPNDRYALILFGRMPMPVLPFTEDVPAITAGLAATGIGRGVTETRLGPGLVTAIERYRERAYSGSRAIVLISDGGAQLDAPTREAVRAGLARERIGLYFIYIRSGPNSPNLEALQPGGDESGDEVALHRFFQSLQTPYRVYQAEDPESIAAAVADIGREQNQPLAYAELVPRLDYTPALYAAAAACALLLLGLRALQLPRWS